MKQILISLIGFFVFDFAFAKCIPANEYIPFVGQALKPNRDGNVALGVYSRVSPDGRFVMRSFSGDHLSAVTLMEISQQADGTMGAKAYQTDFNNEAFPVQGTWRFLVNLDGSHYRVGDLVRSQKEAKRQFRGGISGFYTAAAEMPESNDQKIMIRSLSWPSSASVDLSNETQGTGQLNNEVLVVKKNVDGTYDKVDGKGPFAMCGNLRSTDGAIFSLPMISIDGTEFSAVPQNPKDQKPTARIYRFAVNNKDCEPVDNLDVATSKAIFGFPQKGKKAPLVFLSSSVSGNTPVYGIHLYDRDLKRTFFVGDRTKWIQPDSFPGMTKDGRIIYGAKWKDCSNCAEKTGYIIADLYQSEDMKKFRLSFPEEAKSLKQCVTEEEAASVRAEQAVMYGLPQSK